MKKILVPTDFSPEANNALAYATEMAKQAQAEMRVVNAFSMPVSVGDMPITYVASEEIKDSIEKKLEREAEGICIQNLKVSYEAEIGSAVSVIEDEILNWKPDLIIMGIAHAGKWYGKIVGSTVTKLDNHLGCPILIIPPEATYTQPKKIVLATDGSERIANKWQALKDILLLADAELMLLNIIPDKDSTQSQLLAKDVKQNLYMLSAHDIAGGINDFIAHHKVQLLAMVPHKHTIWEEITSFSNTQQIVFKIKIPLLLLP